MLLPSYKLCYILFCKQCDKGAIKLVVVIVVVVVVVVVVVSTRFKDDTCLELNFVTKKTELSTGNRVKNVRLSVPICVTPLRILVDHC